jgi:predicted SAM-dependent methyltransferase
LTDLRKLLREIYRTLKPGGVVRTALPDLAKIILFYNENQPNKFLDALFENSNSHNYKNYHKWMYTKHSFIQELQNAGFEKDKIEPLDFNISSTQFFAGMDNRPDNSFYIEAKK